MSNKHIKNHIPEYIEGLLSDSTRTQMEGHLKECEECRTELKQYQFLENLLIDQRNIVAPSQALKDGFYNKLQKETLKNTQANTVLLDYFTLKNAFKVAAVLAVLIGTFQMGRLMEKETLPAQLVEQNIETQNERDIALITVLENESASQRINEIYEFQEISNPNEVILKAISERLILDDDINVRLAAARALEDFISINTVRNAFLISLKKEQNPSIQIELINIFSRNIVKESILPMKRLLNEENTEPIVKQQIKILLPTII